VRVSAGFSGPSFVSRILLVLQTYVAYTGRRHVNNESHYFTVSLFDTRLCLRNADYCGSFRQNRMMSAAEFVINGSVQRPVRHVRAFFTRFPSALTSDRPSDGSSTGSAVCGCYKDLCLLPVHNSVHGRRLMHGRNVSNEKITRHLNTATFTTRHTEHLITNYH